MEEIAKDLTEKNVKEGALRLTVRKVYQAEEAAGTKAQGQHLS